MTHDNADYVNHPGFDSRPGKMSGKLCFAGTRIPVSQIRALVKKQGMTPEQVCEFYPDLTPEWVNAAAEWRYR